jgi:hypothetical protein
MKGRGAAVRKSMREAERRVHAQAWARCVALIDSPASALYREREAAQSARFRPESELIREAEAERDRRREIAHARELAAAGRLHREAL